MKALIKDVKNDGSVFLKLNSDIFKITKVWENLNSAQISEITPVKAVQYQVLKHLTLGRIFLSKKC